MKKVGLLFVCMLILSGCSKENLLKIRISNPSTSDKIDEIVEIGWKAIFEKLILTDKDSIVILNEEGKQTPYQIIYNGSSSPQSVIFPTSSSKGETVVYTIKKGQPENFERKTFGRQVPERKDDFAWENDRIAFRMYGPALAGENPSNGVDIWLKKTNELIIDKFYSNELDRKLSYHVDRGLGLDCYKVGHTLGAGGIAPFFHDSLWVGGFYSRVRVLDSGDLRTSFVLEYDSVPVEGKILTGKIEITLDAFTQMNKAVVSYNGDFESFETASGIWLHDGNGITRSDEASGFIAYAEKATSDAGVDAGRNYVGVIIPRGMKKILLKNDHLLALADYKKGEKFTYYFGAGWSQWGFDNDDTWFNYMSKQASRLKESLQITIE